MERIFSNSIRINAYFSLELQVFWEKVNITKIFSNSKRYQRSYDFHKFSNYGETVALL